MRINAAGLAIIKRYEGWSAKPYICPAGRWTIGYGSTWDRDGDPVTADHPRIDNAEGEALLRREVRHVEIAIGKLVTAELTENMFSATGSLVYNIGSGNFQTSQIRMRLNRGQYEDAADIWWQWRRSLGKVLPGLVARREAERRLFLS